MNKTLKNTDNLEFGITTEWLLQCIADLRKDIRWFIIKALYRQNHSRLQWAIRYYGGYEEFYREILQELTFQLLEKKNTIPQKYTYQHIFWNLKTILRKGLYNQSIEISNEDEITFAVENIPDESFDTLESQNRQIQLDSFKKRVEEVNLTNIEKAVLKYHYFNEMDYQEISQVLNINKKQAACYNESAIMKARTHFMLNQYAPNIN